MKASSTQGKINVIEFDGVYVWFGGANGFGGWGRVGEEFFEGLGWLPPDFAHLDKEGLGQAIHQYTSRLVKAIEIYSNAVALRTYIPSMKSSFAAFIWDFSPLLTVRLVKLVVKYLDEARLEALKLGRDRLGTYSVAGSQIHIQSHSQFDAWVSESLKEVQSRAQGELGKPDDHVIEDDKLGGLKLHLFHLDKNVEPGVAF